MYCQLQLFKCVITGFTKKVIQKNMQLKSHEHSNQFQALFGMNSVSSDDCEKKPNVFMNHFVLPSISVKFCHISAVN